MNLSTARSEKRAKEVGIRKAIGSMRPATDQTIFCRIIISCFHCFSYFVDHCDIGVTSFQ
jgi:hypothetical protein